MRRVYSSKKLIKSLFSLLIGGIFFILSAQINPAHSQTPAEFIRSGQIIWVKGDYDSAYSLFQNAQILSKKEKDTLNWLNATFHVGKYYSRTGYIEEANARLDSVIEWQNRVNPLTKSIVLARNEKAYVTMISGEMESSTAQFDQLIKDCQDLPASEDSLKAIVYHMSINLLLSTGDFDRALKLCQQTLEIRKRIFSPDNLSIAYSHNSLGTVYSWQDQYEKALEEYLKALAILEKHLDISHPQMVQIRTNIGVYYEELGLYWEAVDYHKTNLPYLEGLPPTTQLGCLLNLGSSLFSMEDHYEALTYFDMAEEVLKEYPDLTPDNFGYIYGDRSGIYDDLEEYEKALENVNLAIEVNQKIFGSNNYRLVHNYARKGNILSKMERFDEAVTTFEKALKTADKGMAEDAVWRGHALEFYGETLIIKGDPERAIPKLQEAGQVYAQNEGTWNITDVNWKIAKAWRKIGNWDSCFAMHQKAWENLLPDLPFQLTPDEKLYAYWPQKQLSEMIEEQAKSLEIYYEKTGEKKYLNAALASYEAFLAVVDSQRHYYQSPKSKQRQVHTQIQVYESALSILLKMNELKENDELLIKAFTLAEKSKAGNLREHLRGLKAFQIAGIPDSLIGKELYFRQRISFIDGTLYGEYADEENTSKLKEERFALNQDYRKLLGKLEKDYPAYYQLKYPLSSFSFKEINENLGEKQGMYSYFQGVNDIFVFRLFDGKLTANKIPFDQNFINHLSQWLDFIGQSPEKSQLQTEQIASAGHQLYQALLPNLSSEIEQILLIPHGILGYLSFESLLLKEVENNDFRNWEWLASQYATNYVYAAEIWLNENQHRNSESATYLGFAPEFKEGLATNERANLGPLKYNGEEVSKVARLTKGKSFLGFAADEKAIKKLDNERYILHFATHAIADEEELLQSKLYFDSNQDSTEDGILHTYEIYGLNFNSPLTVLSACQTGKGPLLAGEGIMSLARAFQYAGSERILTTLWKTDDRAMSDISVGVFKYLIEDNPSAMALKNARNDWLNQSDSYHCHPYFWAGYILIGDGGEIEIGSQRKLWPWLLGLGILITGIISILIRRVRSQQKLENYY